MNVERRAAVALTHELEYEHQPLIARRRLHQRLQRGRRAGRWWVRQWLAIDQLLDLPPSLSISGVGSSAGGSELTVVGLLFSQSSAVFMFALHLPLPVYLGFPGIPVIRQKCTNLTNLFAVNDVK